MNTIEGNFIESWRGEAVNWECDELGHLNMRHYLTKARQARKMTAMHLGLTHSFDQQAMSTLRLRRAHIRYLKECRPGARLHIKTGITHMGDNNVNMLHMMYHRDGTVAATIDETLEHISVASQKPFDWPERIKHNAKSLITSTPPIAKPRAMDRAEALRLKDRTPAYRDLTSPPYYKIGMGVFREDEMDIFGVATSTNLMGRISESVGHFEAGYPELHERDYSPTHINGVLLEIFIYIHQHPMAGQAYHIHSGVHSVNENIRRFHHHMVNPFNGQPWMHTVAIGALMDLKARKLVKISPAHKKQIEAILIP